ncbi:MAG: M24 family metallopeptidase [Candidatus Dojkabacteria bacterium]
MKDNYKKRKEFLKTLIEVNSLDVILLYSHNLDSRYSKWIAGVTAQSFHYYFITRSKSGFFEISYLADELRTLADEEVIDIEDSDIEDQMSELLKTYKNIGFVGEMPYLHISKLKEKVFVNLTSEVDVQLLSKSDLEISKIKESEDIVNKTFELIKSNIKPGITTEYLATVIEKFFLERNVVNAFAVSIATSQHLRQSTIATPDKTKISKEDFLCIDIGVKKNGYYSDRTMMFFLEDNDIKRAYQVLTRINREVTAIVKPGITLGEIVDQYNQKLKNEDLNNELDVSNLGHSIGFGLHEYPNFYKEKQKGLVLEKNTVITLEPEVTFQGFKLRVEDMVYIA